jgi:DNA-binding response OmpR family regulator
LSATGESGSGHQSVSRVDDEATGSIVAVICERWSAPVNVTTSVAVPDCCVCAAKPGAGISDTRHTALSPNSTVTWPPTAWIVCAPTPPWHPAVPVASAPPRGGAEADATLHDAPGPGPCVAVPEGEPDRFADAPGLGSEDVPTDPVGVASTPAPATCTVGGRVVESTTNPTAAKPTSTAHAVHSSHRRTYRRIGGTGASLRIGYRVPMPCVLVVEDDPAIRAALIEALSEYGHAVRTVGDGFGALREITNIDIDAVVLDLGLPDLDGADALRMIRGISRVPIVIATARDDEAEIIRLLDAGADDFLVKPFSSGQLAARLNAVLRRANGGGLTADASPAVLHEAPLARAQPMSVGDLRIEPKARTVHQSGREVRLTRREFDLLAFLAHHVDQVVSRRTILAEVWRDAYVDDQTIDVHLSALRRKLGERGTRPRYLQTVRGVGIKMVTPR